MDAKYDTGTRVNVPVRILAWVALVVLVLGSFWTPLAPWAVGFITVWFLRCLKPPRGFGFVVLAYLLIGLTSWRGLEYPAVSHFGWVATASLLVCLPFFVDRVVAPRYLGFASTLVLPLVGVAANGLSGLLLPERVFSFIALGHGQGENLFLAALGRALGAPGVGFLVLWFAATLNWFSESAIRVSSLRTRLIGSLTAIVAVAVLAGSVLGRFIQSDELSLKANPVFAGVCAALAGSLCGWIYLRNRRKSSSWTSKSDVVSILRSPKTGSDLHAFVDQDEESLVSRAGERFPVTNGIPTFVSQNEVDGLNDKYSKLYDRFGGFYDDATRIEAMLKNGDEDAIRRGWMQCVQVRPGDWVLETSVGSGFNLKLLPRDARYFGLDLSKEMLRRGRYSLERWGINVELFQGNAQALPFKDEVFDVVYHVGSINFFSDPTAAILEMIRVAKPGAGIVIADETEKDMTIPMVDRVPPQMEGIHTQEICDGDVYVVTFRKPLFLNSPSIVLPAEVVLQ